MSDFRQKLTLKKLFKKIIVAILTLEAKVALFRFKPKIIAVTGSVGKTSTKDAIYTIFSKLTSARKSEKSFNSEFGVPLTILGLKTAWGNPFLWVIRILHGFFMAIFQINYPKWLILEIGAGHPGDIKKLTRWVHPDIAVINKIGKLPVHVEFFKSPDDVAREKSLLAKALKPGGSLVLYADDDQVLKIAEVTRAKKLVTFGFNEKADVLASHYAIVYKKEDDFETPSGISLKVNFAGNSIPIIIDGALGRSHAYPALAGVGVAVAERFNIASVGEALRNHQTPPGRMRIIKGLKNSTIIDDTYNSSPEATTEALKTVSEINIVGRKIVVLGDMLELGSYSRDAHLDAGKEASKICDILCAVGVGGRIIAEGALQGGMDESKIFQYDNSEEAGNEIQNLIQKGDVVLVKGSQGARMEKIVENIMAEPEKAGELLVRQEKVWKKR